MNGERLKLSAKATELSLTAESILGTKGIEQIGAYHHLRTEIWKYQATNLVSEIVWSEIEVNSKIFQFPAIQDQLISLPDDIELMQSYKERVVDFWRDVTQGWQVWRQSSNNPSEEIPDMIINLTEAEKLITQCDWATLWANTFDQQLRRWTLDPEPCYQEFMIQLGWGGPDQAGYWQYWLLAWFLLAKGCES